MLSKAPKHIAIILDGNRRFAKKLGLQPWKGHEFGLRKLEDLFNWCIELNIKELTLYAFSTENFKRARKEVDYLFSLFWKEFNDMEKDRWIFANKVRVNVIGRQWMFPKRIQKAMRDVIKKTAKNSKLVVNFALAYGGRQEITDAVRKIIKAGLKSIDDKTIAGYLYLKSEPDIVIRPGGEVRTSNFLTWQSVYSEFVFLDKLWPEFTKGDLIKCIREFSQRERRFGA
jgi:tritrans,polycis-undecaprenyl-diphosphate synthase [geranylgeranyl-diphosphate specific]